MARYNAPQYKLDEQEVIRNYRDDFLYVRGYFDFAKELIASLPTKTEEGLTRSFTITTIVNSMLLLEYKYGVQVLRRKDNALFMLKALYRVLINKTDKTLTLSLNETGLKVLMNEKPLQRDWLQQKTDGLGVTMFAKELVE